MMERGKVSGQELYKFSSFIFNTDTYMYIRVHLFYFFYYCFWPSYLTDLLSLGLAEAIGARNYARGSFVRWVLSGIST